MSLSDTLVARALETNGLSYGDPATRRPYLLHQYPGDRTPQGDPSIAAVQMGGVQSGCLLHVRGLLAENEVDGTIGWRGQLVDVLRCTYQAPYLGLVEGMLEDLGRQRGLLTTDPDALGALEPADVVLVGQGGSPPRDATARANWLATWGGVAHGLLVTGRSGELVESSDGGQTDMRNLGRPTAITRNERALVRRGNTWWLGTRRVAWRLRAPALPLRLPSVSTRKHPHHHRRRRRHHQRDRTMPETTDTISLSSATVGKIRSALGAGQAAKDARAEREAAGAALTTAEARYHVAQTAEAEAHAAADATRVDALAALEADLKAAEEPPPAPPADSPAPVPPSDSPAPSPASSAEAPQN